MSHRVAWGEPRAFFIDPVTRRVRSLPTAWTDLSPADPFVQLAAGRAHVRLTDLQALVSLLNELERAVQVNHDV